MTSPKGTFDILPLADQAWQQSHLWHFFEEKVFAAADLYGFEEIRTPLFERTELFTRGVGDSSDIVSKEMYTFADKGGRSMTLRPEMTASVMRAFIEHHLDQKAALHKLFYMGPMFRYDRPQAGRYRQFHQFGAEIIGQKSPLIDVEMIDFAFSVYRALGLENLHLFINSVGDAAARAAYSAALRNYLPADKLSEDSQRRLHTNTLRILDSKDPGDQALLEGAPQLADFLSPASKAYLATVIAALEELGYKPSIAPRLVRGLDYYNETVFEITAGGGQAQNALCGGGRYDGLIKLLGGPDLPGVGFAMGIERVLQTWLAAGKAPAGAAAPALFLIPLGSDATALCFKILQNLRQENISALMDYSGKKIKDQLKIASDKGSRYALIIGDEELQSGQAELKDLASRSSKKVPWKNIVSLLKGVLS